MLIHRLGGAAPLCYPKAFEAIWEEDTNAGAGACSAAPGGCGRRIFGRRVTIT